MATLATYIAWALITEHGWRYWPAFVGTLALSFVGGGNASTIHGLMGLFNKLLHAGEGRKIKSLESIVPVAGAVTPVPGGVGQMTVACLLVNTLRAACAIAGLPKPAV